MVDYHVDRPGVEAPQGVELTGTNSSEILLTHTSCSRGTWKFFSIQLSRRDRLRAQARRLGGDQVSGAHGGGVPPVPIPNTAVKPASADDSRTAGSLESRSVPDLSDGEELAAAMPAGSLRFRARPEKLGGRLGLRG